MVMGQFEFDQLLINNIAGIAKLDAPIAPLVAASTDRQLHIFVQICKTSIFRRTSIGTARRENEQSRQEHNSFGLETAAQRRRHTNYRIRYSISVRKYVYSLDPTSTSSISTSSEWKNVSTAAGKPDRLEAKPTVAGTELYYELTDRNDLHADYEYRVAALNGKGVGIFSDSAEAG
jgi:hypothetical protein